MVGGTTVTAFKPVKVDGGYKAKPGKKGIVPPAEQRKARKKAAKKNPPKAENEPKAKPEDKGKPAPKGRSKPEAGGKKKRRSRSGGPGTPAVGAIARFASAIV